MNYLYTYYISIIYINKCVKFQIATSRTERLVSEYTDRHG